MYAARQGVDSEVVHGPAVDYLLRALQRIEYRWTGAELGGMGSRYHVGKSATNPATLHGQ